MTDSSAAHHDAAHPAAAKHRRTSVPGNLIRGGLIGVIETVPGVSGGTVALVVGIYQQLIDSASAVVSAVRRLITGPDRRTGFAEQMAHVHWGVVIPVLIAMPLGLFIAVQFIADWVTNHPELTRAAFFGMVLVSITVPLRMAHRSARGTVPRRYWAVALAVAAVTFFLVSLPPGQVQPHWWIVLPAAAVAVSALLLPGLSGSFLLLTFGLYEPSITAARDLDFGYIAVFGAGMVIGVVSIIKGLKWLLDHHYTAAMVVLSGVMLGALRTLWPWQDADRNLLAPDDLLLPAAGLAAAGAAVVGLLVFIDARMTPRH